MSHFSTDPQGIQRSRCPVVVVQCDAWIQYDVHGRPAVDSEKQFWANYQPLVSRLTKHDEYIHITVYSIGLIRRP